jgi:hypothetical protein
VVVQEEANFAEAFSMMEERWCQDFVIVDYFSSFDKRVVSLASSPSPTLNVPRVYLMYLNE